MTTWAHAWDESTGQERARAAFAAAFGATPPAGVWSAPGRVNLIGEHTDYNGGLCLPVALAHRTFAAVRPRVDDAARMASSWDPTAVVHLALESVAPGTVDGWTAYVAGVAWSLREQGHRVGGFDVAVDSCVPVGAGLSSSAALECSVALALDELNGLGLEREVLTAAAVRAENEIAGAPTGGMDQAAALRTIPGHALLLDCRDLSVRHVPFAPEADGLALLVIDTRTEHALVDGQYAARRATCEDAAALLGVPTLRELTDVPGDAERALATLDDGSEGSDVRVRRVRHVLAEIQRVVEFVDLLDAGRLRETGPLLDASHASLRDDYEVSCLELDVAVEAARAAGALGARMTGGGFGGSAIALVEVDAVTAVADAVDAAFRERGLRAPSFVA
ncbi:galactokinase [Cellulomonas sp. DKR-3]|uniref:Galactokinase n=1 Tax=Cellulomonas fulva TaxID=2835530 RepID=A0ABS5TZC8_9CELL|nr:galactokinase [Cellulomonas fulva]MBT0994452.1 galactokinase [Cellulomonas fulva]